MSLVLLAPLSVTIVVAADPCPPLRTSESVDSEVLRHNEMMMRMIMPSATGSGEYDYARIYTA